MSESRDRSRRAAFAGYGLAGLLCGLLSVTALLAPIEERLATAWLSAGEADPRIRLVTLGDDWLAAEPDLPAERCVELAALVGRLVDAGAIVALDLMGGCDGHVCACAGLPGGDPLAATLRRAGDRVLLPTRYHRGADGRLTGVVRPPESARGADTVLGFVNLEQTDGVAVRAVLEQRLGERLLRAFALQAARLVDGVAGANVQVTERQLVFGSRTVPLHRGRLPIRFRRLREPLPARALLEAPARMGELAGRLALIGIETTEDRHFTPLRVVSGLRLHAHVADTVLSGTTAVPPPLPVVMLVLAALSAAASELWRRAGSLRWPAMGGLLVVWLGGAGAAVLGLSLALPGVSGALAAGLGAGVATWLGGRRLARRLEELEQAPDPPAVVPDARDQWIRSRSPHPLAQQYARQKEITDPLRDLRAELDLFELTVRLLAALVLGDLARDRPAPRWARRIVKGFQDLHRPTLGQWIGCVRELLRRAPRADLARGAILPILHAALVKDGRHRNLAAVAAQLNRLRICSAHELVATSDDTALEEQAALARELLTVLFEQASVLAEIPLYRALACEEGADGRVRLRLLRLRGLSPERVELVSAQRLRPERIYAARRGGGAFVPLWPFLVYERCEVHRQPEYMVYQEGLAHGDELRWAGFSVDCRPAAAQDEDLLADLHAFRRAWGIPT